MARPWRCGEQGRNVVARSGAREKGPKVRPGPGPLRLRRACAVVDDCARAASLHGHVRECECAGAGPRRWQGAATHDMAAQGTKKQNKATTRAVELAAAPARESFPAWLEGRHHQRRWRGASVAFPLGSKAGASIEGRGRSFSPWWPQVVVQASVKIGGTARRREGRRRRRGDVEAEEVGALDDGGSGSSHGWLRSSRRTASNSSSPPLLLLSLLSSGGGVDRGGISPKAARVGRTQGAAARLLIGEAQHRARGRPGCSGGPRGASRRRPHAARPALWTPASAKGEKGG
jgi:hypothetical protein